MDDKDKKKTNIIKLEITTVNGIEKVDEVNAYEETDTRINASGYLVSVEEIKKEVLEDGKKVVKKENKYTRTPITISVPKSSIISINKVRSREHNNKKKE